jgi:hypothetical protein
MGKPLHRTTRPAIGVDPVVASRRQLVVHGDRTIGRAAR